MPTEGATHISGLNSSVPLNTETAGEADDHLRMIKLTLKNVFADQTGDAWDTGLTVGPRTVNNVLGEFSVSGNDLEVGDASTSVKINGTTAPDLVDEGAALVIGPGAGQHLEFGILTLQAKSGVGSATTLNLNTLGAGSSGDISMGGTGTSVVVQGTNPPSASVATAALVVGPTADEHLEFGQYSVGSGIQSKANASTIDTLYLQPVGGNSVLGSGSTTIVDVSSLLHVLSTDAPILGDAESAFRVGDGASQHLELGDNDLQAKSDATTATALDLNPLGGDVTIGGGNLTIDDGTTGAQDILLTNDNMGTVLELESGFGGFVINQTDAAGAVEDRWIDCARNGAVSVYFNGVETLRTETSGARVIGTDGLALQASGGVDVQVRCGTGVPTGGAQGDLYLRTDGGAGTTLYIHEGGSWVAK